MTKIAFKHSKTPNYLLFVILPVVLFPALTLVVQGSANVCIFFLLLCSLIYLGFCSKPLASVAVFNRFWPVHLSMAALIIAILINQLIRGAFAEWVWDAPLRLALFAPVFLILLLLTTDDLKKVQWGFVAGSIFAAVKIYILTANAPARIGDVGFINAIPYGNISLLLGVLSLLSLGWSYRRTRYLNGVKILGGIAGAYASFLSQSRGGWLALPFFIVLGLNLTSEVSKNFKIKVSIAVLVLTLLSAVAIFSKTVQSRFAEAGADINDFYTGKNLDTAVGTRFQLWRGALVLFREHPMIGVGRENFSSELEKLAGRHIISPAAAKFSHSHNEILFSMATLGLFGLAAILSIYLLPAAYFLLYLKNKDREIVTAASVGLATCLSFAFFGLTETMFVLSMSSAFYTLIIATSLAIIARREQGIESLKP